MKSKIFYGTRTMNEYSLNASHGGLCNNIQYKKCVKVKKCLEQFCANDEKEIIKDEVDWRNVNQDIIYRYNKQWKKCREKWFKQCKPVEFIIRRIKK